MLDRTTFTFYNETSCHHLVGRLLPCRLIGRTDGFEPSSLGSIPSEAAMNNKFLQEAINLERRWSKSGLLKGMKNSRATTAVLMECQRLLNEMPPDNPNHCDAKENCPIKARGDCPHFKVEIMD